MNKMVKTNKQTKKTAALVELHLSGEAGQRWVLNNNILNEQIIQCARKL